MDILFSNQKLRIKALWLIPMPVDCIFQSTSRAEAARALYNYSIDVEAIAGYQTVPIKNPGYSKLHLFKTNSKGIQWKFYNMTKIMFNIVRIDPEIIIFSPGIPTIVLLPLMRLYSFVLKKQQIIVLDIRSIPTPESVEKKHINSFLIALRAANLFADGITVITSRIKKNIAPYVPNKADQIIVWESGVRTDIFNLAVDKSLRNKLFNKSDFVITYHGHLTKTRGLHELIEAVSILKRKLPHLKLLLVGDGEDRKDLEKFTKKLDISNRVVFTGKVPYEKVPGYIGVANLAVIPLPDYECWNVSSPLKLMEYLAMGIPVIATNIPAHRTVLDEFGGGITISDHFSQTIAEAILNVYTGAIKIPAAVKDVNEKIDWHKRIEQLAGYLWHLYIKRRKANKRLKN